MHVLATGVTEFVGGWLVPTSLTAGREVRMLARDPGGYGRSSVTTDLKGRDRRYVELPPFDDAVATALGTGPATDATALIAPPSPEAGSG